MVRLNVVIRDGGTYSRGGSYELHCQPALPLSVTVCEIASLVGILDAPARELDQGCDRPTDVLLPRLCSRQRHSLSLHRIAV